MNRNKPAVSEIKFVTCSVENLERSIKFYRDVFGYVVSDTFYIAGKEFEKAWRIPPGLKGKCVVLGVKGIDSGMLRLVQWDKPGERIWGSYLPREIVGYYAINFGVKDLQAFWPRLIKAGATPKAQPKLWQVDENISAWDSQAFDLDGVLLDIFQDVPKNKPVHPENTPDVSEIETMALHVTDAVRYKQFCIDIGFSTVFYETMIKNMEQFFGLPAGTKLHNINMMNKEYSKNGRIEIAQYVDCPNRKIPLSDRSVPPNIGILSMSFKTVDIEETCQLIKKLGGQEISGPVQVVLPGVGKVKLTTFIGIEGEMLEYYQPEN